MSGEGFSRQGRLTREYVERNTWSVQQANEAENNLASALLIPASILVGLTPFSLIGSQPLSVARGWQISAVLILLVISMSAGAIHFFLAQKFHQSNAEAYRSLVRKLDGPSMTDEEMSAELESAQGSVKAKSQILPLVVQALSLTLAVMFFIGFVVGSIYS